MGSVPYDSSYSPAAPVIEVVLANPLVALSETTHLLIDTGAEQTVVPYDLVVRLKVPLNNPVPVYGFGGAGTMLMECVITISLPGLTPVAVAVLTGPTHTHHVLGRDVLNHYRVVLDGPNQTLEIS